MTTDPPPLHDINPARVSVLAVGLETYGDLDDDWDLPGAGLHAVRFAEWAIDHLVPPERVRLGCTWVGGLEDPRATALAAKGVRITSTATDDIRAAASDLVSNGGDLLLVYWCGHGVSVSRERRLLTTGAVRVPLQLANFRIDDLQGLLGMKSEEIIGFHQQVMFFDACANELEGRRLPDPGNWGPFADSRAQQLLYYSTDLGLYAEFDKDAGHAAYSTELLTWLEDHPDTFPPDFLRLSDDVHTLFREKKDEFLNRPVRLYTGVFEEGGADFIYESASLALQPSQLTTVERAVEQSLTEAPELMSSESQSVRVIFASGGGDKFVSAMCDSAKASDSDRLKHAAAHVSESYKRQKWILEPLRTIENVDLDTLRAAYRAARQGSADDFIVEGLAQTLDHAASFGLRYKATARLYRLVARLEWETGKRVDAWFKNELDSDVLARVRDSCRPGESSPHTVVVFDLTEADESSDAPQLKTHTWVANEENPRGWWEASSSRACGTTRQEVARAVAEEFREVFHTRHPDADPDAASVGFILTPDRIPWRPELWEVPVWDKHTNEVMAQSLPVVLHLRRRERYATKWQLRLGAVLQRARTGVPAVEWLSPSARPQARLDTDICCTALDYRPLVQAGAGPFEALLRTGAPFILWSDDDPSDAAAARDRITAVVKAGLEDFPERLRDDLRDIAAETGFSLRVVWDHEARLPPNPNLRLPPNPNARTTEEVQ